MNAWPKGTVVVLGAEGMLAHVLVPRVKERTGRAGGTVLAWGRSELDITNHPEVDDRIVRARPTVVINCAAYTDVDGAQTNVEEAMATNAAGPENLARACRAANALLVHYSTDFVFDGSSSRPYRTTDAPNPLCVYGTSKHLGAAAICTSGCSHLVIRTSWLYGPHGRNFVDTVLTRAHKSEALRVVNDQTGRPTYTMDLADATTRLLDTEARGIVHVANSGQCSWHEFAVEIVTQSGFTAPVQAMSSEELNRPARRPAYSVLDLSSYETATGATMRHWKQGLKDYLTLRNAHRGAGA